MMQPCPTPPTRHLFGCPLHPHAISLVRRRTWRVYRTKETMQPRPTPPTRHLFGPAADLALVALGLIHERVNHAATLLHQRRRVWGGAAASIVMHYSCA